MSENAKEMQASACFMCQQAGRGGCLECRTQRLIADIRMQAYEKLGAEQNRSEWEERAISAESERDQARKERDEIIKSVAEHVTVRGQYLARATAAEQQVRSLEASLASLKKVAQDAFNDMKRSTQGDWEIEGCDTYRVHKALGDALAAVPPSPSSPGMRSTTPAENAALEAAIEKRYFSSPKDRAREAVIEAARDCIRVVQDQKCDWNQLMKLRDALAALDALEAERR